MARLVFALAAFGGPFLLAWIYLRSVRLRRGRNTAMLLTLIGALLAAETFVVAALDRPAAQGRFEPARLEGGVIQPGRIAPEGGR
jgi:hypothetical protein